MKAPLRITAGSDHVFRDLGFEEGTAENLRLRADLMLRVESFVKRAGLTQREAASVLGITQPRLNQLLRGRIERFSLDALVNMLARAGLRVRMSVRRAA
jgi:predicted XRE-type DNA-binding protein